MLKLAGETDLGILEAHEDSLNPHLVETLPVLIKGGNLLHIPTNTGWAEVLVGSGTTVPGVFDLAVKTSVTANSSGLRHAYVKGFNTGGTSYSRVNWDKKLYFIFNVARYETGDAECVARIQIKQAIVEGALDVDGIGIRLDNTTLVGESWGSELGELDLSTAFTSGRQYQIVIIHYPASKIEWYVNGALVGTQSTSAKIPSGESAARTDLVVSIKNGATGGYNSQLSIMQPKLWQEI